MDQLDSSVLVVILSYVGNAADFCRLEQVNQTFHTLLHKNDHVWSHCPECQPACYPNHKYLNRELARCALAVKHMEQYGKQTASDLISQVLELEGWKRLFHQILSTCLPPHLQNYIYDLRGDTSYALLSIVGASLCKGLENAGVVAVHRFKSSSSFSSSTCLCEKDLFPTVTRNDFGIQHVLSFSSEDNMVMGLPSEEERTDWDQDDLFGVDQATRKRLAVRLAWNSGIAKMDYEMYHFIWCMLIKTVLELVTPVCALLVKEGDPRFLHRSYLSSKFVFPSLPKRIVVLRGRPVEEVIRKVAPLPHLVEGKCCPLCRLIPAVFTMVPYHIESVAKQLHIVPHKVLDREWHCFEEGQTVTSVKAQAQSRYILLDQDEDDDNSDDNIWPMLPWVEPPVAPPAIHPHQAVAQAGAEEEQEEENEEEEDDDVEDEDVEEDDAEEDDENDDADEEEPEQQPVPVGSESQNDELSAGDEEWEAESSSDESEDLSSDLSLVVPIMEALEESEIPVCRHENGFVDVTHVPSILM